MKSSPTLVLLLVLLMLVCAVPVRSENACGWVLYSDITTTVDGVPVRTYNIGGRMFIPAETLAELGFAVTVDEATATIAVEEKLLVNSPVTLAAEFVQEEADSSDTPELLSGQRTQEYFIPTHGVTLHGTEAECFDVDGKTCVSLDDVAAAFAAPTGYVWDEENRELRLTTALPDGE